MSGNRRQADDRKTGKSTPPDDGAHPARPWHLVDMHCHLDRMADAGACARDTAARSIALLDVTVTPEDAERALARFARTHHVRVGVGLHPWWLADGRCGEADVARTVLMAARSRYIGEVGLDFSARFAASRAVQLEAFESIVRVCAARAIAGRVMSLHAVHAASEALDVLERYDLPRTCACIFHWFSGTGDDLARLRRLRCRVSVNERMLATKRGREYARQLPEELLLLETDAPAELDAPCSAAELEASLVRTLTKLAALRGVDTARLGARIADASTELLDLG